MKPEHAELPNHGRAEEEEQQQEKIFFVLNGSSLFVPTLD